MIKNNVIFLILVCIKKMQNTENIKVALRIKPIKETVNIKVDNNIITLNENGKDSQYIFDHIFDINTTQQDIFSTIGKPSVDWVCEGYNATIFAYGSTGSGKTFTMFGHEDGKSNMGIIPRACEALFQNIEKNEDVIEATMKCSFLEIYREHIRDLLKKDTSCELKIRQSQIKGIFVQGLTEKYVYSSTDILNTIKEGSSRRTVGSTSLNTVSSRSHSLLTLTLTQILSDGTEITSKLNLVDLAGSENVGKSEVQGISLAEAQNINKSLCSLGNVIYALTEKNREHIPYRDSKLTFLLQDSLGGNSKTTLIATVNFGNNSISESINTLKFAKRAKEIKNIPKVNKFESIQNLLKTIEELNQKIKILEKDSENNDNTTTLIQNEINTEETSRLQNNIEILEKELDRYREYLAEHNKVLEEQRTYSETIAKELNRERLKNCVSVAQLEQYKIFYDEAKSMSNRPELLSRFVKNSEIVKEFKDVNMILNPETNFYSDFNFLEDGSASL